MSKKKDLVIAATGGYTWEQVDVWALSLIKSGFKGIGAVIIYDNPAAPNEANQRIIANLKQLGFQCIVMPLRGSVFNQRFHDFYEVIRSAQKDLRYVVVTDIRDVYFQADPIEWVEANMKKNFLAVSEAIKFKDEAWNRDNLNSGFPALASRIMDKLVFNVGVLAGKANHIADLCLSVAQIAKSSGFQVADQSGYNLLLDMESHKSSHQVVLSEDGFACQAGTLADPNKIEGFRPLLQEPEPRLTEEGVVTNGGKLYPIVHQYDRVPEWNAALRKILNDKLKV